MTDIIERVARAIGAVECHENGIAFEQILFGRDIDAIARAAIAAMREPTAEIEAAIAGFAPSWLPFHGDLAWQAAIDAALDTKAVSAPSPSRPQSP